MKKNFSQTRFKNQETFNVCKKYFEKIINLYNEDDSEGISDNFNFLLIDISENIKTQNFDKETTIRFLTQLNRLFCQYDDAIGQLNRSIMHILLIAKDFLDHEKDVNRLIVNCDAMEHFIKEMTKSIKLEQIKDEEYKNKIDNISEFQKDFLKMSKEHQEKILKVLDDMKKQNDINKIELEQKINEYSLRLFFEDNKKMKEDKASLYEHIIDVYSLDAIAKSYKDLIEYIKEYFEITINIDYKNVLKSYELDKKETITNLCELFEKNIKETIKDNSKINNILSDKVYLFFKGLKDFNKYKTYNYKNIDKYELFEIENKYKNQILEFNQIKLDVDVDLNNRTFILTSNYILYILQENYINKIKEKVLKGGKND